MGKEFFYFASAASALTLLASCSMPQRSAQEVAASPTPIFSEAPKHTSPTAQIRRLEDDVIGEFMLGQNYPNPLRDSTKISFVLPRTLRVNMGLYNVLARGREDLIADTILPQGNYVATITFPEEFPRGIYFYRLNSGEFSGTKTLTLVE